MSDETLKIFATAVVVLCQVYATRDSDFPLLAYFWDIVAKITGHLANALAHISVAARYNYFTEVSHG